MAEDDAADDPTSSSPAAKPPKDVGKSKNRSGMVARMWRGIFGGGDDGYEKRLRYLSKEEASVHARMKRRALRSRRTARNVIVFSFLLELVAVTYAIMTTRPQDLDWKTRALRVLPMFALPLLSILMYSTLTYLTRMFVLKDQKTLERLRAERQAKIDELKEKSNYYKIQQLIQRYDLDPAAKAAAATVLASKLGADSGLKVFLGDESVPTGRSKDMELEQSKGFRRRKQSQFIDDTSIGSNTAEQEDSLEHYKGSNPNDGGWLARIAALLVGEDPTQCYALICGNCHMHNGLARKEDFAYITYYCPHCHVLNCSQRGEDNVLEWSSGKDTPSAPGNGSAISNAASLSGSPVASKASPLEGLPEGVEEISES